jgi:hypothetical protein
LSIKNYWLYAVDEYGSISEPETVTIESGVSVEENTMAWTRVYPNPTYILLTIETVTSGPYTIKITSLNGHLIYSKEMEGTTHQIDLSSFQKGVYIITIRSKDFTTTRKIIKL